MSIFPFDLLTNFKDVANKLRFYERKTMNKAGKSMTRSRFYQINTGSHTGCAPLLPFSSMFLSILPYVILAAIVFVAYSNVYANAFLYDDKVLIVYNQFLRSWQHLYDLFITPIGAGGGNFSSVYYRPMQMLLYMFVFQTAGLSLFAFHLLCVTIHVLNTSLVYMLGRKLGFKPAAVFCAALLWAVHPLQTDAVTYVSAMADTLNSFFCLCGIVVIVPDFTPRRLLLAVPFMILGFLSKEAAICFPLLAMSCFYLLNNKRFEPKAYLRFWPLFLVTGVYVALHLIMQQNWTESSSTSLVTAKSGGFDAFATLPVYARLMLWPTHLHMGHDFPGYKELWHPDVLFGFGLLVAAELQIFFHPSGRNLPFNWGLCWFAASLAPAFTVSDVYYEHWIYLSSAGLFLGIAQMLALSMEKLPQKIMPRARRGVITVVASLASLFVFMSYQQNLVWREPVAFYNNIIAEDEKAIYAHNNLGAVYMERGEYENAITHYQIAIEKSGDTLAMPETNLGVVLTRLPDPEAHADEALAHLHRALEINPHFYPALIALETFYSQKGDAREAALYHAKADALRKKFGTTPDAPM